MTVGGAGRPTENRAARVARAQALRERGMLLREIAAEMGVAIQTVDTWLSDPDLSKQRARRERYAGTCKTCGARTTGCNGREQAPERCAACEHAWLMTEEGKEARRSWTLARIVKTLQWWNDEFGEPPAAPDWMPVKARQNNDPEREARGRRMISEGLIPDARTVFSHFGSWNAALVAAGFTPRPAHGGGGNELRRRSARRAA